MLADKICINTDKVCITLTKYASLFWMYILDACVCDMTAWWSTEREQNILFAKILIKISTLWFAIIILSKYVR